MNNNAPGHTDLMVCPETLDAWLEANPLPADPVPAKGFRFYHSRVLDERNEPQLYEVSRLARGVVYYQPVYAEGLGKPDCCPADEFPRWCLRPC